jgi:tetratricopeptide (TPR) repeat protein
MRYSYRLLKDDSGRWNISREKLPSVDVADYFLVVPFQIALEDERPEEDQGRRNPHRKRKRTERGLGGQMLLQGETTQFSIPLDAEPRKFWLDQGGEVLASFLGKGARPKQILLWEASKLTGEDAEKVLKDALNARYISEGALKESDYTKKELERYGRYIDAEVLLRLAQLYLDQGRDEEARQAFEEGMSKITGVDRGWWYRTRRLLLESRFDIREGDFKSAYSRLSNKVRLRLPRSFDDSLREVARYKKFRSGRTVSGDGYAMLALSAHMTGHDYIARKACEEAEERGVDMAALRELMPEDSD